MTTGTNTAEIRSASRCTAALPFWASSTSRAIWASWVSAPTRVARTTRRPPALTVAPTTAVARADLDRHRLTGEQRRVHRQVPSTTTPSVAIFSPGRTTNTSPTASWSTGIRGLDAVAQDRDVLGAEFEQRAQRRAGAPLGAGLEIAAGEDEHGDRRGDLEVDVCRAGAPGEGG